MWFPSCTTQDRNDLQREVRAAERLIRTTLTTIYKTSTLADFKRRPAVSLRNSYRSPSLRILGITHHQHVLKNHRKGSTSYRFSHLSQRSNSFLTWYYKVKSYSRLNTISCHSLLLNLYLLTYLDNHLSINYTVISGRDRRGDSPSPEVWGFVIIRTGQEVIWGAFLCAWGVNRMVDGMTITTQ